MRTPYGFLWLVAVVVGCGSCHDQPVSRTPQEVWTELVAAGCAAPDDAGPRFVAAQLDAGGEPWLTCLSMGGSIQSCAVPCAHGTP